MLRLHKYADLRLVSFRCYLGLWHVCPSLYCERTVIVYSNSDDGSKVMPSDPSLAL